MIIGLMGAVGRSQGHAPGTLIDVGCYTKCVLERREFYANAHFMPFHSTISMKG